VSPHQDPSKDPSKNPSKRPAFGYAMATFTVDEGQVLDAWFPRPQLTATEAELVEAGAPVDAVDGVAVLSAGSINQSFGGTAARLGVDDARGVEVRAVAVLIADLDQPPQHALDAYLRLHLLSHRMVQPRSINMDGIFGVLNNVVWTSRGPCAVTNFEHTRMRLMADEPVNVFGIDKFPRMVDYVVPEGVRIADADRVRLGAHLATGTTVMHEGFVNFNAGTLGASMVEGRISAGVVVGDGSDIGGGASIMGTLSGGGTEVISIGERCLVGANAGVGISLGDDCIVEAGLYLTAGTKVRLPDESVVRARDLSSKPNLRYWRNSISGAVEAVPRSGTWVGLNEALHAN